MKKMVGWMLATVVVVAGASGVWAQVDDSVQRAREELAVRQAEAARSAAEKAAADAAVAKAEAMVKEAEARTRLASLPQTAPGTPTAAPVMHGGVKGVDVYRSEFGNAAGAEWSKTTVTKSPSGKRTFLGPFSNESVTLSLRDLPEHSRLRLSFDLMIIMTWDGDLYLDEPQAHAEGPDLFDVTVDRGPRLTHASFVARPSSAEWTQSFPGRFPYDHLPAGTGAAESRTLGYKYLGAGGEGLPDDYVYHIERSFGHHGQSLKIAFSGIHLQGVDDEAWGLDKVRVEVLPEGTATRIDDTAFERLWGDLGSADPKAFAPAVDEMIDLGDPAVAAIRKRLVPPATRTDRDQLIGKWITQLDDDSYSKREEASAALRDLGAEAEPALRATREKSTSMEVCSRIDALLEHMKGGRAEGETERRQRRLVEVLELIGTEQARAGLSDIAQCTGTWAALEAKGAIQRLDGKAEIPTTLDVPPGLPKLRPPAPTVTPTGLEIDDRLPQW